MDFGHEQVHPGEVLDIQRLATDHAALLHGLGGEEVAEPDLGRERGVPVLHGGRVGVAWLTAG